MARLTHYLMEGKLQYSLKLLSHCNSKGLLNVDELHQLLHSLFFVSIKHLDSVAWRILLVSLVGQTELEFFRNELLRSDLLLLYYLHLLISTKSFEYRGRTERVLISRLFNI